jgi:hypothetical protein
MKEYSIGAFLDIEGAFDNTPLDTIKLAMNRYVPEALVDWTENMLAGRRIMVYHGERVVDRQRLSTGRSFIPIALVPCRKRPFRGITKRRLSRLWIC